MIDEVQLYRARIGLRCLRHVKVKGLTYLTIFEFFVIMSLVLLQCGDIEINPGPDDDNLDTSGMSTFSDDHDIRKKFSVVHYNIQSLNNKLELITNELQNFDVIGLTETWLDGRVSDNDISMNGYTLYRHDRRGNNHGGICVYAKSTIYSKRRTDLELLDLECIWLELHCNHRHIL